MIRTRWGDFRDDVELLKGTNIHSLPSAMRLGTECLQGTNYLCVPIEASSSEVNMTPFALATEFP